MGIAKVTDKCDSDVRRT